MSLLDIARKDHQRILNDTYGFALPITVTNPDAVSQPINGYTNDISLVIDPDTGQAITGRTVTIVIHLQDLKDVGFTSYPKNVSDKSLKPWLVTFDNIDGSNIFKIIKSNPDRTLNSLLCYLEFYKP